jgi:hypothetical protein
MKQKNMFKINLWCKYNAWVSYTNNIYKLKIKPLNIEQDFIQDWAIKRIFIAMK